jgi:alkanesulfonate monooxygenase SsuD/methylene tetrahydromethanopterin reductase-like flavin-dependent oxidoreductase (luciferase family)
VIRLLWSAERSVSFEGKHYRLADARPGRRPADPISIWVGAFKPRMIRLIGRKADGWGETIAGFVEDGFDTIIFWPVDTSLEQVERLIAEVLPQLASPIP